MVAPIYFNVEEARNQLLKYERVYTGRSQRGTGLTIARQGSLYKGLKLGRVHIRFIKKIVEPAELEPYLGESGFQTVNTWLRKIKGGLPTYLYLAEMLYKYEPPIPYGRGGKS